jgi:hypothetical protein
VHCNNANRVLVWNNAFFGKQPIGPLVLCFWLIVLSLFFRRLLYTLRSRIGAEAGMVGDTGAPKTLCGVGASTRVGSGTSDFEQCTDRLFLVERCWGVWYSGNGCDNVAQVLKGLPLFVGVQVLGRFAGCLKVSASMSSGVETERYCVSV